MGVLDRHAHNGPGLQVDGVLGGMRQVSAAVLHLRDLRVRILGVRPVVVGPFLRPRPVEPGQLGPRRRSDPGRLGEPGQPRRVRLARVPAHDAPHGRVGFERRRVDPNRVPPHELGIGQPLQDPREHGLVGLQVNQAAGARQRRMVRRGLMEIDIQEGADTQRIGRAPCDRALRVQAFTIPEQQQPARPARRQTRPTHRGSIEPRALLLHEGVKTRIVEHTIQPLVEWMPSALWQIRRRDPHGRLSVARSRLAHRHG